ncbi:hypothetical protein VQH23_07925 [Pararoseomonas sp. SCSIO 73927]|uniref:hypothetical protein n=1 Tax=Pararoseomonas sp. SCSIO 73927 TaxID=3114537 RepID=UPI0030CCADDC
MTLHLHDTRGLAVANAHAGLRMEVASFDATVGGLGGCPFPAHEGAPGNIASEELALLCEELGIGTGIDLDALIEAGHLAERIVGHRLPTALVRGGSPRGFRRRAAQGATRWRPKRRRRRGYASSGSPTSSRDPARACCWPTWARM